MAPTSCRNSLLQAGGTSSTGQGTPGSGGGRRSSLLPAGGTGSTGQGSPGSGSRRRSSLLPKTSSSTCSPGPQPNARPKPLPVTVRLTRQQQLDQALMQTCHGIAPCVRIAMQGLADQRREHLPKDSLVASYAVRRHVAESMRIPMQESSDLLLRYTPFTLEIPRNHLMLVSVWSTMHGQMMLVIWQWNFYWKQWLKLGCNPPPPPPDPMTLDKDPPRGDPSESNVPACAL